ncbi:MAG: ribulose-phosphate 3-epimerase [Lentisphaeria bacterium]
MSHFPLPVPAAGRVRVAPSLLAADFARLAEEVRRVAEAGAEVLHLDIMDGHFVPNLTIGPALVEALRKTTTLPFDVHLMVSHPSRFVTPFAEAGADGITFHVECADPVTETLAQIRAAGCATGLSVRPKTPATALLPWLNQLDLVLVMTVEPGYGGQAFMPDMLPKIRDLRQAIDRTGRPVHLEVDGGVGPKNVAEVVAAGANLLVAGTSVFRAADPAAAIRTLRGTP